jgi:hypothetical protein
MAVRRGLSCLLLVAIGLLASSGARGDPHYSKFDKPPNGLVGN